MTSDVDTVKKATRTRRYGADGSKERCPLLRPPNSLRRNAIRLLFVSLFILELGGRYARVSILNKNRINKKHYSLTLNYNKEARYHEPTVSIGSYVGTY